MVLVNVEDGWRYRVVVSNPSCGAGECRRRLFQIQAVVLVNVEDGWRYRVVVSNPSCGAGECRRRLAL